MHPSTKAPTITLRPTDFEHLPAVLTTREAANALRIGIKELRNLVDAGQLPEATVPDSRAKAVDKLADELGLSRSQVVDEAVAMFIQAVTAARGGRRLVAVSSDAAAGPDCLITTPTLAALEWTSGSVELTVSPEALQRVRALIAEPPVPGKRARAAVARFKKATPGE